MIILQTYLHTIETFTCGGMDGNFELPKEGLAHRKSKVGFQA